MSGMAHQAQGQRDLLVEQSLPPSQYQQPHQRTRGRERVADGLRIVRFDHAASSEPGCRGRCQLDKGKYSCRGLILTSEPQSPVAITLIRTCLGEGSFGTGRSA